jgi:hypothetical protein
MSQKSKIVLKNEIDAQVFENSSELVTATNVNNILNDMVDSSNWFESYTSTPTSGGTTTLLNNSTYQQFFTGTSTETVVLPVASTLFLGQAFLVKNDSTSTVLVQSSGLDLVQSMVPGSMSIVTCVQSSGTDATSWSSYYSQGKGYVKNHIPPGTTVTVDINEEYLIYGDILIEGILDNNGTVVVLNGVMTLRDDGEFINSGDYRNVDITGSGGSGVSGYSGYSGYSGTNGTNGASGFSGYSGTNGTNGASGFSGYSGYSGAGTSGFSGYSGFSGDDAGLLVMIINSLGL